MEIGSGARIAVVPVSGEAPRVTSVAPPDSVRTELPTARTAQQAEPPSRTLTGGRSPADDVDVARQLTIDARTREVVFRAIDRRSGEVVRQVPDEALLRIRAYARQLRQADTASDGNARVERIA